MVVLMDWQFASGCSPPRLSTTQFPPATDSQCSVRKGLSPSCWCALSGALGCGSAAPGLCRAFCGGGGDAADVGLEVDVFALEELGQGGAEVVVATPFVHVILPR